MSSLPSKRKAASTLVAASTKKLAKEANGKPAFTDESAPEKHEIVQRQFYPPEMTNERALQYKNKELPLPVEQLNAVIKATRVERGKIRVKKAVIHWFKWDLRLQDNTSLHQAAQKAKDAGVPLICMYLVDPQAFQAHFTSAVRVDFALRTLAVIKADLAKLDIPLYVETIEKRKRLPGRIIELAKQWNANHIYCNIEYEVDELRREIQLTRECLAQGISFEAVHDTCVVAPGELSSQTGTQYAVYSPWYRAWTAYLNTRPRALDGYATPGQNPAATRDAYKAIFETKIPDAPENKRLSAQDAKKFHAMWPAGEHEAHERLAMFLKQRVGAYKEARNIPAVNGTACLSVHFSSGTLSARTAIRHARDANTTKKLDGGNFGIITWISEVAWRDFYKHVLARWPYVCMNKPFKPEYTNIEWGYNTEHFAAWCEGRTGYPIVDAAMRQMNHTGYMHNRCRMIVASFFAKHLLLDWRMGERYFMENLIDGDFASNNGGWGWSASTGVDPQPYFRIFNPLLQSEKFDTEGTYIRKWVPELKEVKGKAIHAPHDRGMGAKCKGYPKPIVEHKFARDRALTKYKEGLGKPVT